MRHALLVPAVSHLEQQAAFGSGACAYQPLLESKPPEQQVGYTPAHQLSMLRCHVQVEAVCPMEAEVGGPAWLFGYKAYHVLRSGQVLAVYSNPKAAGVPHYIYVQ